MIVIPEEVALASVELRDATVELLAEWKDDDGPAQRLLLDRMADIRMRWMKAMDAWKPRTSASPEADPPLTWDPPEDLRAP